jgi:uncharacterized protein (TIGR00266 family)
MRYEIEYSPSFALGIITLDTGEQVQAEAGAMVSMSPSIAVQSSVRGGLMSGLKRSFLAGESLFINTFTAESPGEVTVAPALPGDIIVLEVTEGRTLFVQSGSFLAATMGVNVDTKWGGGKTFFSREGLFLLKCTGSGTIFVSSYGAIRLIDLAPGQEYRVDTGHMVAFDDSVSYEVGKAGGWKTTLLGGEGLVCKLKGPGRFYFQTRSPESFISWLTPQLPGRRA